MAATDEFLRTIADAIRPDERLGIAEWSARRRILPAHSPEPGKWRNDRTPYLVGIMDALSGIPSSVTRYAHDDTRLFDNSFVRINALMKGHQLGGSALGENFVGHSIETAAGNMLAVFATKDDAEKWVLDRFEPMRESTPELRKRVGDADRKGSDNTKLRKKFPGGMLNLVSAVRAGRLKSTTIRYVLLEEIDEYLLNVDGQGNPIELAKNRTSNFGRRAKIFANSTPTIEGRSQIAMMYLAGDQRRYFVPCPECGHPQFFEWKNLKWNDGDPDSATYFCQACGIGNAEHAWKGQYPLSYWMPTAPGDGETASFHLSAMYAPLGWRPWSKAVRDWIAAQSDIDKLIAFVNNFLADCWKDRSHEMAWQKIKRREESYLQSSIPVGCLIITASVDTQGDRLEVGIDGWGRGMVNWTVDHVIIPGDPSTQEPWTALDKLLETAIVNSFGVPMRIELCAVDSGGHHAQEVYDYCRLRQHRGVFAVKGSKEQHRPIIGRPTQQDVTINGAIYKNGVQLWHVGTDTAKTRIFAALVADEEAVPTDRRMRFPAGLDDEYYKQLVAEAYNPAKDRWEKLRTRNEVLDNKVYNLACAYHPRLRINMMKESDWLQLEAALEPRIGDLFSAPIIVSNCPAEAAAVADPVPVGAGDENDPDVSDASLPAPEVVAVQQSQQKTTWLPRRTNWIRR